MNKLWNFCRANKRLLLACLFVVILYAPYQFYPQFNELVGWGMAWTIGRLIPDSMSLIAIAPWVVAVLFWAMISIVYWLAGVRNSVLAAALGLSVSIFLTSLLRVIVQQGWLVEIFGGVLAAYLLFAVSAWLASKLRVSHVLAGIIGAIVVGLSIYFTPLVVSHIAYQKMESRNENEFQRATQSLKFTPFYPTYKSSIYPASPAKLNGYRNEAYTNETVTFLLGRAQVKQSALLEGQDKVMDFTKNCSFYRIWFDMENGTSIKERDIQSSLDNPQKCNLLQTTPSGKKVYFYSNGQWTGFYVKLDRTNFIIEFDDVNGRKYDVGHQDELLKIIDSLQPLDKTKLENGNEYGHGFSS